MIHTYAFNSGTACGILGVTRQAYYKALKPKAELDHKPIRQVSSQIIEARKMCPTQGCRSMYEDFGEQLPMGRDKSILIFKSLGCRVKYPKTIRESHTVRHQRVPKSVGTKRCQWNKSSLASRYGSLPLLKHEVVYNLYHRCLQSGNCWLRGF